MNGVEAEPQKLVENVVRLVVPSVRAERPYVVGGISDLPIKLNQNESPLDVPDGLKAQILEKARTIPFNRYPREHPDRLATALADFHGVSPDAILVGNGSNELSYLLGLCLVRESTPVVLPRPMFSLYEKVVRLYGGDVHGIPPRGDLRFDADAILEAVRRIRPVLTVLTTPNNPTGLAMRFDEVVRIVESATGVVVVDEAYVEFNEEPSAFGLLDKHPNLLVMRTFSKAFGLAGLRVGYLIGHPSLLAEFRKARLPFVVDAIAEAAVLLLIENRSLIDDRVRMLKEERLRMEQEMSRISGLRLVPSQANFVIFRTDKEPPKVMSRLAEAGVLVRDVGGYPELPGYLRVNAGTPDENRAFLAALKDALSG